MDDLPDLLEAQVKPRSRWRFDLIWLVPLVAALIGGWLAVVGGLIFCVAMILTGQNTAFGAVAPIGGVLMIAAWLLLAFAAFRKASTSA